MSVGAHNLWVAGLGLVIVGLAAWFLCRTPGHAGTVASSSWLLTLRIGLGPEPEALLGGTFDAHLQKRDLVSIETARQGAALDLVYEVQLRANAEALVKNLHRLEGVQGASLKRRSADLD